MILTVVCNGFEWEPNFWIESEREQVKRKRGDKKGVLC